jgi:acyl-CoA reductase-like NAD-dependent aldehyde dehydrogenase
MGAGCNVDSWRLVAERALRLISSETFKTGVLNLVYGPAESTGAATYEDAKVHLPQPEEEE